MSSERSISHCIQIFGEVATGNWNHEILAALLQDTKTALAFTSKDLLTPLRHAVTGMKVRSVPGIAYMFKLDTKWLIQDGPSMAHTMETLGKERTLHRLRRSISDSCR